MINKVKKLFIKSLECIYVLILFLIMSFLFYPVVLRDILLNENFINISIAIVATITGFAAVLLSIYVLQPLVFRAVDTVGDEKVLTILNKTLKELNYQKIPKIYKIRTAQINAVAYLMFNKKCIGLTTGLVEAHQKNIINDQDLKYILFYTLSYHIKGNSFKRSFMLGIASFYSAVGYILIFLGMGFLKLTKISAQRLSRLFSTFLGYLCVLVGIMFRIPEKIGSILSFYLIYHFQKNADLLAQNNTSAEVMQESVKKIHEYNKSIDKKITILPFPEYWFVKPVRLLIVDKIILFRKR